MPTTMHRLQISLPEWQAEYLKQRARRDGVSIAEVVRRLVQRDAEMVGEDTGRESLWSIAGIGEDRKPLKKGVPVSERPDLYLTGRPNGESGATAVKRDDGKRARR